MKIYRKFSFVYKAPFIKFSLEETNPGEQYAYYIIKNERRLLITPYSDRNWITYDTRYEPGIWRVSYFVKPPDPADWGTTNHYFLNEKRLYFDEKTATLEGEIPADDAPLAIRGKYEYNFAHFPPKVAPANEAPGKEAVENGDVAREAPEKLLIFLPSAVAVGSERTNPVYVRWTWTKKGVFPGRVLVMADPLEQLFPEISVSWLIGDPEHDMIREAAGIIGAIAAKFGVESRNIYFYGSSAGGFSAIALASYFEGSTAISADGQINIKKFFIPNVLELFREHVLDGHDWDKLDGMMGERLNLLPRLKNANFRVVLLQNLTDETHYREHFLPAWQALGGGAPAKPGLYSQGVHKAKLFSLPGGHNAAGGPETCKEIFDILAREDAEASKAAQTDPVYLKDLPKDAAPPRIPQKEDALSKTAQEEATASQTTAAADLPREIQDETPLAKAERDNRDVSKTSKSDADISRPIPETEKAPKVSEREKTANFFTKIRKLIIGK